jgi:hypothetical protein
VAETLAGKIGPQVQPRRAWTLVPASLGTLWRELRRSALSAG